MWEIYAYHNSESLFGIFNAIAAIMNSGSYMGSIAVVLFVGFFAALFSYAFAPQKLQGWQWLASVVIVYSILFVPKVTVQIIDRTGGSAVQVVDNVPLGIASLGGLTSSVGNSITQLMETAFQVLPGNAALPAELSYQQTGLMFGSRILQHTRSVSFPDPAFKADLMSFLTNCTAYDIADNTISVASLSTTDDIWTLVQTTNPARFTRISDAAGLTVAPCNLAWTSLNSRIGSNVSALRLTLATTLNPTVPTGAAAALIDNQVYQAYVRSRIAGASATAAGLIRQNAMINAVNDASQLSCQQISDPACMLGATSRALAVANQNAAWINGAKVASDALPVIRNVAEALIYAIFPLIVLLLFLTSGKSTITFLTSYLAVLISIQLWPPLFAILNYMASIYSQSNAAAAADIGGGVAALAARTANPIYSTSISAQAVVSYVMVLIPVLSWSLANRLTNFGSALIGGSASIQSSVTTATAAATAGNVSMGNTSMDQTMVSPTTSNPFVGSAQDRQGNWITTDANGRRAVKLMQSQGITSHVVSTQATQGDVETANQTASTSANELLAAGSAQSAALTQALTKVRSDTSSARSSAGHSRSSSDDVSNAAESLWSEAKRISAATGVSEDQAAGILLKFGAMPSAGGVGGGAALEKRYGMKLSDDERKVLDKSSAESFKTARSFADKASRDTSFLNSLGADGQGGSSLASALASTAHRTETASRGFAEASSWAQQVQSSLTNGTTISRDLAKDPAYFDAVMEYERQAVHYQNNPQALQAIWASTIGAVASTPTHFRNGAAAPQSPSSIRGQYDSATGDASVNPDIAAVGSRNNQAVSNGQLLPPPKAPAAALPGPAQMPSAPAMLPGSPAALQDSSSFRNDVVGAGGQTKSGADGDYNTFDARHEIVRTPDGTTTHQSMVKRVTTNVGNDASVVAADAVAASNQQMAEARERAANSPLQKAIDATPEIPRMLPSAGKRKPTN